MIQRTLNQAGIEIPDGNSAALAAYSDRGQVADYARGAVAGLLKVSGIPLYAPALRKDTEDVRQVDMTKAAVVIGSEGRGISEEMLDLCEKSLKIPMEEKCESLNAAVAAAVVLWEGYR